MTQQVYVPARVGLMDLLMTNGTQFVIPAYQRNYTWQYNKEVKLLIDDIKRVLKGECDRHFIGIMICLDRPISAMMRERSVIDGQQRLTTIFLLLYAVKYLMIENGMEADANMLENQYLINPYDKTNRFKLKPLVSDDAVYQKIVNGDIDSIDEKDSNVYLNFVYIRNEISSLMNTYTINDILMTINKLYLVIVPVGEDDYPQKIFESINATGSKLTASDLIRNFLLMPIKGEKQDEYYEKYWKKLEELIDRDSKKLEAFFRFFIMAKKMMMVNKNAVYAAFTKWYEENVEEMKPEGIFKEIDIYAKCFYIIYKKDTSSLPSPLKQAIIEFRLLPSDMPAPMLMEFYRMYIEKNSEGKSLITNTQLADIFNVLNSYLLRRGLSGYPTSDITRYFPYLLKDVLNECNGNYSNIVDIFKKNLINRNKGKNQEMPDKKKLRERIINANMYNAISYLRIFFRKLESDKNPAPVDFNKLNIEHIMPQTPTKEWYDALGVDKETYEENLNRLGNLTFAAKVDNSKMSNKVWEYKNIILKSTMHLKMNYEIISKDKWLISDINERTEQLINEINRLYPYYEAKDAMIEKMPIFIDNDNYYAEAIFYPDNGSVEILQGSDVCPSGNNSELYPDVEEIRQYLIDEGIIVDTGNGMRFSQNYTFYSKRTNATALSMAAEVILHGSKNGWIMWRTKNGLPLSMIDGIKKGCD